MDTLLHASPFWQPGKLNKDMRRMAKIMLNSCHMYIPTWGKDIIRTADQLTHPLKISKGVGTQVLYNLGPLGMKQ